MTRKTRRVQEPPLSLSPEIVIPSASRPYERWLLSRVPSSPLVLLPESFRGGCSFGTALKRFLPTMMRRSLSSKTCYWQGPNDATEQILAPSAPSHRRYAATSSGNSVSQPDFFSGSPLRFVEAKSSSSFFVMDFSMVLEAPFKLDFLISPRLAASAAPAAFCWACDLAGMSGSPLNDGSIRKMPPCVDCSVEAVRPAAKFPFEIGDKQGYRLEDGCKSHTTAGGDGENAAHFLRDPDVVAGFCP